MSVCLSHRRSGNAVCQILCLAAAAALLFAEWVINRKEGEMFIVHWRPRALVFPMRVSNDLPFAAPSFLRSLSLYIISRACGAACVRNKNE